MTTAATKKCQLFDERENHGYAYEKRAPPYVGMPPPRMVNPALYMVRHKKFSATVWNYSEEFYTFSYHIRTYTLLVLTAFRPNYCLKVSIASSNITT